MDTFCFQEAYRQALARDAEAYRARAREAAAREKLQGFSQASSITDDIRRVMGEALPDAMASNDIRARLSVPCDTKQIEQALRRLVQAGEIEFLGKVVVRSRICNLYRMSSK